MRTKRFGNVNIHYMEAHTPEWHEFRKKGIGGSEVASMLGLFSDKAWGINPMQLYHMKVGDEDIQIDQNERMHWGTVIEELVAKQWQYYDGSVYGLMDNFKNNNIIRTCKRVNGYAVNPKYPFLFASVDRLIDKGCTTLIVDKDTGLLKALDTVAPLEIKCIDKWTDYRLEDGLPDYYLVQLMAYLIVYEVMYGEFAMLIGGNELKVIPVEYDKELADMILYNAEVFWAKVETGRELYKSMLEEMESHNYENAEALKAEIVSIEPEPTASGVDEKFMKDRHEAEDDSEIDVSGKDFNLCEPLFESQYDVHAAAYLYEKARMIESEAKSQKGLYKNKMIKLLNANEVNRVNLGGKDKFYFTAKKAFKVSLKESAPDKEEIKKKFEYLQED